jgi:hypothetical protein
MVGGFNTNIRYQGQIYHVQTEDGGKDSPSIITLLYRGGAILFSKKTSYADQLDEADRESIVRQLMEAQHSAMVQALKSGKADDKLGLVSADAQTNPGASPVARSAEFGADVLSRRSLDEVIVAHLAAR